MSTSAPPAEQPSSPSATVLRLVGSFVLLIPALLAGLGGLLWPSAATVLTSLQKVSLIESGQFIGFQNYAQVLQDKPLTQVWSYTLSLAVARLLIVAIVPPLLALAVSRFGRGVRLSVRLLFTLPLAMFAPVAVAAIWSMFFRSAAGLPFSRGLDSPDSARRTLVLVDGLYTFGLACAVGLIVYLPALRRTPQQAAWSRKPLLASWVLGLLATLALTLQSFTLSYVLSRGGPAGATSTLALYEFQTAFQFFRFGAGAAIAVLTLLALAVLGLAAGLIVVFTGLQLEALPLREPAAPAADQPAAAGGAAKPAKGPAAAGLAVLLLVSLALGAVSALPLLWNLFNSITTPAAYSDFLRRLPAGQILVNTVLPPSLMGLWQVAIAYLAALGIGALRPFGKWSEVLLLPVSPWLFVTVIPLSLAAFKTLQGFGLLGTLPGLVPPLPISVPMVFVLTLFFKGQYPKWRAARAAGKSTLGSFLGQMLLPSLPLALFLAVVALLTGFQELYWPLLAGSTPASRTMATTFIFLGANLGPGTQSELSAAITLFELPVSVLFFVVLGAFQCLYLDRLALTTANN